MSRPTSSRGDERGYTMVGVIMGMFATASIVLTAFLAVGGDIQLGRVDIDEKRALAAAEAGVNEYVYRLNEDGAYWLYCDQAPAPAPVNPYWDGSGAEPVWEWRNVPDSTARYRIEILPAPPDDDPATPDFTQCVPNQGESVIDPSSKALRIRVTGQSGERVRTLVTTLRRDTFLDYLYFTDKETTDPAQFEINQRGYTITGGSSPTATSNLDKWAAPNCDRYRRDGRPVSSSTTGQWAGTYNWPGNTGTAAPRPRARQTPIACTEIVFASGEYLRGPVHTNDEFVVCNTGAGNPIFGRSRSAGDSLPRDQIRWSGPNWHKGPSSCGSTSAPDFGNNVPVANAPQLRLPPTNTELKTVAKPEYRYAGRTNIVLNPNGTLTINGTVRDWPVNGVIYVSNAACGTGYSVLDPYSPDQAPGTGCGDVYVHGTYAKSLTIAAERDIVIDEDILGDGEQPLLGLIANNFIRVYHPVTNQFRAGQCTPSLGNMLTASNDVDLNGVIDPVPANVSPNPMYDVTIEAAMLSLNHVFTVDNYHCGARMGNLTVHGAIGQKFRGPVGVVGAAGYNKQYTYDDRLKYRSPPYFIDPVQSAWRLVRQVEQTPPIRRAAPAGGT